MMDGEEMQMDRQFEDPADASENDAAGNGEQLEEYHLGYNPQLNGVYDPQLRDDRHENKKKLRRRFEHIFEKYERDFEGIGDEIDLATGEIVVDNGHLQNMRNEHDAGNRVDGEEVVSSVEHSDVNESEEEFGDDEDGESDAESVVGDVRNGSFTALDGGLFEADDSTQESDTGDHSAHASRGAGPDTRNLGPLGVRSASVASSASATPSKNGSSHDTPANILEQVPGLKESMLTVQSNYKHGKTMDPVAIHALGMSIANQLAAFISRNGEEKGKRRSKRTRDSTWSGPEVPGDQAAKRPRSPSPELGIAEPSSVEKKSIWAPIRHPRQQKRRRVKERELTQPAEQTENEALSVSEDNMSAQPSPQRVRDGKVRSCNNCGTSDSHIWRKGPNGVLCNTCGMYVYRYGLMRPVGPAMQGDVPMTRGDDPITPEATEGENDPLEKDWWLGFDSGKRKEEKVKPVGVRNSHFVLEEDALIIKLKEIDLLSWERMATYFPGRSAYALQCRYSKRLHSMAPEARNVLLEQGYKGTLNDKGIVVFSYTRDVFKEDEDELLLKLRDEDGLEWEAVAASLPGRTPEVLEQRYNELARKYLGLNVDDSKPKGWQKPPTKESSYPSTKSLRYSAEEDALIVKLREVDKLGWAQVADQMNGRNSFSLQKRYIRELCGRHPDSTCQPRKAYERATPSLEARREEGDDSDVGPEFYDSLANYSRSPTQAGVPSSGHGSLPTGQDYRTNDESFNATIESETAESQADANSANNFTDAEDSLIIKLREVESLPWDAIAAHLPDRDVSSISARYYHHLHSKAVKTTAEKVARRQPPSPATSTVSASKTRDGGKRWTQEESTLAENLQREGKSFSEIAAHLPGRTPAAVKSRLGAMFDPNKKAYQQRVARNSTGNPKSQAPLLRQAVDNARRRSMSALSFEDDGGTAALSGELAVRPAQPALRPLMPKTLPTQETTLAQRLPHELQASRTDASQRLHFGLNQSQISDGLLSGPGSTSTSSAVQIANHVDGHRNIYPDTPARSNVLHSSSTEVTPIAAALYATPARYHQQGHPYFLAPPLPLPVPYSSPNGNVQNEHHDELRKGPAVAKSARPLPMPKAGNSKRAPKASSQNKAKAPTKTVSKNANRKSKAAQKSPSPSEDSNDDEDLIGYNSSDNESTTPDATSDDVSDSDFADTAPITKVRKHAKSVVENVEARKDGEASEDTGDALQSEDGLGGATIDHNSTQELKKQTVSGGSNGEMADREVNNQQVDNSSNEGDETNEPKRPKFTYTQLVTMALESKAPEPLTLADICEFMKMEFEYFRRSKVAWWNSVRSTLRRGHQFKEESMDGTSSWSLLDAPSIEKAEHVARSAAEALQDEEQVTELPRSVLFDTAYVKAHPKETFIHRGHGRWEKLCGLQRPSATASVAEPAADGKEDGASTQDGSEVKHATKRKYRPRKPKSVGDDNTNLPDANRRGPGRPRIHPSGPKRPRGRPPKNRKDVNELSSSAVKGPDEIPNSDAGDLDSSEDMLVDTMPSQELKSSGTELSMLDDDATKPTNEPLPSTVTSSGQSDAVRPLANPSSDIIREPQTDLDTWNTLDQQGLDEPSLIEDSSELSIRTNDPLATSSPITSKRASKQYGRTSTPGTASSTLFSQSKETRARAKASPAKATPSAIPRIRSIVEPYSRKRIVFTPMRDFDDSEDELAL